MTIDPGSKLPNVGTTIFTVMSKLANDVGAINLSQGFPSFDPPKDLLDRVAWHLHHGDNQYAPMPGVPALRQALIKKIARLQGRTLDPDTEITICTGATEGLFASIQAIVRPGDDVIVFDPAYDSYEPAVTLAGGTTRHLPLSIEGGEFSLDVQRLKDAINDRTRLVICNFPHNPTGAILQRSDLDDLADALRNSNAFLLSDEVYEHIVFDGQQHVSLLQHDELWERSLIVSSFGKTFHTTGWKVGFCAAPPALTAEFRRVHQFTVFTTITPVQHALADYLEMDPAFYEELPQFYAHKRDLFCDLLEGSRFKLTPTRSTFFQLLDYAAITDELDVDLAKRWTKEIGVASIPLTVFCEQALPGKWLRFCFAKDDPTLERAAEKLKAL